MNSSKRRQRRRRRSRVGTYLRLAPLLILAGLLFAYLAVTYKEFPYGMQLTIATLVAFGVPLEVFRTERKSLRFWLWFVALLATHFLCCYVWRLPKPHWRPKELAFLSIVEAGVLTYVLATLMGTWFDPSDYDEDQPREA